MAIGGLGLYFRLYPLLPPERVSEKQARAVAEQLVRSRLENQIKNQIESEISNLDPQLSLGIVKKRTQEIIDEEGESFRNTVNQAAEEIKRRSQGSGIDYLLGADSYYYYGLTENILQKGAISEQITNGKFFNPLRLFPKGVWSLTTWHPHVGASLFKIIKKFVPSISLMKALSYTPLLLSVFALLSFCFFCTSLKVDVISFVAGGVTLMLSPIFLQRGSFGWYDTDPYNFLFPFLILGCLFHAFKKKTALMVFFSAFAGLLTGVYSQYWIGWPWLFLMSLAIIAAVFIYKMIFRPIRTSTAMQVLVFYFIFSVLSLFVIMTPAGFLKAVADGAIYLPKFAGMEYNPWPDIFVTVGETKNVELLKLIHITGNLMTFGFAVFGACIAGYIFKKKSHHEHFLHWLISLALGLPLLWLALRTERFSVLFVIPLCFWIVLACEALKQILLPKLESILKDKIRGARALSRLVFGVLIVMFLLPLQLVFAHGVSLGLKPIMDEGWYEALSEAKTLSPDKAVIVSWWPPGHFITALSDRRVFTDGASQHLPETYWIARFFMATQEEEALGILRMLLSGGNAAAETLLNSGFEPSRAIRLINRIVPVDKEDARKILSVEAPGVNTEEFLRLTHKEIEKELAYIFIYDEMVEKTLAMSFISGWDFDRAEESRKSNRNKQAGLHAKNQYVRNISKFSNGFLNYSSAMKLVKRDDEVLSYEKGLSVDLKENRAHVVIPNQGKQGALQSLFLLRDSNLKEIENKGHELQISSLLYGSEYSYAILADRKLIQSMLYRLYFLNGESLKHFKMLFSKSSDETGDRFKFFQVI